MSIGCSECGKIYTTVGPKGDTGATGPAGVDASAVKTPILANGTSLTLTGPDTGSLVLLDRAAGVDIFLPTGPADGTYFTFETKTDPSGGTYAINAGLTDIVTGFVYGKDGTNPDIVLTPSLGTERMIALNGTTSGGLIGTSFDVVYSATDAAWYTSGATMGSGSLISPFA